MDRSLCALCAIALLFSGCEQFKNLRSQSPDDDDFAIENATPRVESTFLGEYTTVSGLNLITLQGVGLVVLKDPTGSDPPPSIHRTSLVEEMRRQRIEDPHTLLRSPYTALVIVRAYSPPLVRRGDTFDVHDVRLPGNSDATSLAGGRLYSTRLTERAIIPGEGILEGDVYAIAKGPLLVSTANEKNGEKAGVLRRGKILAGATSLKDRDMSMMLRNESRSYRNSKRIADRIGMRFYGYNRYGLREPLAEAKSDKKIVLKIAAQYRDNFPRYLDVIRNIAFQEDSVTRRIRMEQLADELLEPKMSAKAAIRLEAIGHEAISTLKRGLESPFLEVRFHAASALAYLEDASGVKHLAEAVRTEPAFRAFGLAAMSAVDDSESHLLLRELLNDPSEETRYGAFRALTVMDKNDLLVRGEEMNSEFRLHVLDTTGPEMVHLTNRRKAEVVLFGANQRFQTPFYARAGKHIMVNAAANSDTVVVSRFNVDDNDQQKVVSTKIADVIRAVAELDASFPDVASLLFQAEQQGNIPGSLGIDRLPQAGRTYVRPTHDELARQASTTVGRGHLVPNLFDDADETGESPNRSNEDKKPSVRDNRGESRSGRASVIDTRTPDLSQPEVPHAKKSSWYDPFNWFAGKESSGRP